MASPKINKLDSTGSNANPKVIASESRMKVDLNRDFTFNVSVLNDLGQMIKKEGKIKFIITDAEIIAILNTKKVIFNFSCVSLCVFLCSKSICHAHFRRNFAF